MCALSRRSALAVFAGAVSGPIVPAAATHEHALFINVAFAMRQRAIENGDQPYGAVVVRNGDVIGYGPSRVVAKNDPNAHAEREAIREAQVMLNRDDLTDCVLYSTSRPCAACEKAAYDARISRMFYGWDATDAGPPRQ
jgi:tRNA(Arg) A34 adenosine deaminase TadA